MEKFSVNFDGYFTVDAIDEEHAAEVAAHILNKLNALLMYPQTYDFDVFSVELSEDDSLDRTIIGVVE
jgi:hypothetical protein